MKRSIFFVVSLMLTMFLGACSDTNDITSPQIDDISRIATGGEIHTELLEAVYAKGDLAKQAKSTQLSVVSNAANTILTRHGLEPMSDSDIEKELLRGREMAQMDPIELIRNILSPEELIWWDRFSWEAKLSDARKVYTKHCAMYGTPDKDGMLSNLLDHALASSEFWGPYRENDKPVYQNPYVEETQKSWRGVLRFVVAVAVDGASGALVSGGGPVASGVVGGLASIGADTLIFGD